jgi:hypothetical protein
LIADQAKVGVTSKKRRTLVSHTFNLVKVGEMSKRKRTLVSHTFNLAKVGETSKKRRTKKKRTNVLLDFHTLIADQAKVGAMNKKMRRTFVPNYSRAAKH